MLGLITGQGALIVDGVWRAFSPGISISLAVGVHTVTPIGRPFRISLTARSAGGGGGTDFGGQGATGGGGGAYADPASNIVTLLPGKTYTVTVGAGAGRAPNGSPGGNGGSTTFVNTTDTVTLLELSGGLGGSLTVTGTGGTVIVGSGTPGVTGHVNVPPDGGAGGNSGFGTGGGVGGFSGTGGPGGDATAPGGGGGGGNGNATYDGGAGANGDLTMAFVA